MTLEEEEQRSILGELLFPRIRALLRNNYEHTPKITDMLVNFEFYDVDDIIESLESKFVLYERVREAEGLNPQD